MTHLHHLHASSTAPSDSGAQCRRPQASHRGLQRAARAGLAAALVSCSPGGWAQTGLEVSQLSLEDLLRMEVTTVSRKAQRLTGTAAAAFVLTGDDIQRSGATSLPEALRLVPGVEVARIGSSRWAVSARGFNSRFANKLLVLVDGRSVYSPLFSGVFWEAEDVLLEDIERIEVIRGSGAALWGANAVNGIINIVTRAARRTQGTLVSALAGDEERAQVGVRHGRALDDDTALRLWAKGGLRQQVIDLIGQRSGADWRYSRAGFRLDRDAAASQRLLLTGGVHDGVSGETLIVPSLTGPAYAKPVFNAQVNRGANLLGRIEWIQANGAPATLQAYVDHSLVDMGTVLREQRTTVDLDFQSRLAPSSGHDVVWGGGLRHSRDHITTTGGDVISIAPTSRNHRLLNAFVHDEITIVPETWKLIAGTKAEHNNYTGLEWQPNLRAVWTPTPHQTGWGALSRAVRTPSRAERDAEVNLQTLPPQTAANPSPLPMLVHVQSNPALDSESVLSAELGYRTQLGQSASLDIAAFRSHYRGLRSGATTTDQPTPVSTGAAPYLLYDTITANGLNAHSSGVEVALDWRVTPTWRLQGSYNRLKLQASRIGDPSNDGAADTAEGNSPRYQFGISSSLDLPGQKQLDVRLKRVGQRLSQGIPAYTELDLRWAWRVTPQWELSVVGQNLLGPHAESNSEPLRSEALQVPRGAYVKARMQF